MVNWDTSQAQGEVLINATNTVTDKYWRNGSYNTGAQDGCSCKYWKLWRTKKMWVGPVQSILNTTI